MIYGAVGREQDGVVVVVVVKTVEMIRGIRRIVKAPTTAFRHLACFFLFTRRFKRRPVVFRRRVGRVEGLDTRKKSA